jgi:hypothetical protein
MAKVAASSATKSNPNFAGLRGLPGTVKNPGKNGVVSLPSLFHAWGHEHAEK